MYEHIDCEVYDIVQPATIIIGDLNGNRLVDDQLEEIRLTELQAALQTSVTTALQTVLQEHHGQCAAQGDNPQNQHQQRDEQIIASDDEDVVDNVFADGGPNQRGRRNNAHGDNQEQRVNQPIRWEASFKSDIPEFQGTLNLEDFIDWLNMVEEILEFRQVPDDARVSMVVTRFKGQAMAWWQQLKESRRQANKACINSWDRLTKHMRRGFLPFNYERTLYNKLQNLRQGTRSVDEYATEFFYMTARMTTSATQQQLISRFIGGLRYQLQVALAQFNPSTVSKAHQRAVSMELQLRSLGSSTSRARFTNAFASDTIVQSTTDGTQTRSDTPKTGTNTYTIANSCPPCTNALRCFTCGERRHIQTSYPNKTRHGLVIQEAEDDEPQPNSRSTYLMATLWSLVASPASPPGPIEADTLEMNLCYCQVNSDDPSA
uniref:Retrotransposon gag domain-containing protein n=1 Tax=Brassica oleracea var. oleracea TaxID=109376 RepID=A0A0D3CPY2_BRAOL